MKISLINLCIVTLVLLLCCFAVETEAKAKKCKAPLKWNAKLKKCTKPKKGGRRRQLPQVAQRQQQMLRPRLQLQLRNFLKRSCMSQ
uniref:Uncharacterized protein LOC108038853 n=1 Tax=Drosophila rhopaloa TaxID=1041015 RepID=A0A6P4DZR5_DRORH